MEASLGGNDDYSSLKMHSCSGECREETRSMGFFFLLCVKDFYERFSGFYDHFSLFYDHSDFIPLKFSWNLPNPEQIGPTDEFKLGYLGYAGY